MLCHRLKDVCVLRQKLRLFKQVFSNGRIKFFNVKCEKLVQVFIVNTISVFLHWFKPIASWMFLFVVSKIALLICPNLFFAGFMSLTVGLLLKFSLWSFRVIKLLFSPSISNGFSNSLFLKIFSPSILIFSLCCYQFSFISRLWHFLSYDWNVPRNASHKITVPRNLAGFPVL